MSDTCQGCGVGCDSGCTVSCVSSGTLNCLGCFATCVEGCVAGCAHVCTTTCSSCTGTCIGSCTGSCTACTNSCTSACDNACTAASQAEIIANIGANIIRGNIIKAADFTGLKSAIEKEYQRRSKTAPPAFSPAVTVGNKINLNAIVQVLDDCYNFNSNSANDWRNTVVKGDQVMASKIQPCVTFIKTLATQITVK